MKRAWIALLITFAAVLPARFYIAFNLVDQKNGFYTDGGTLAGIAAAAALLGAVLASAFGRRKTQPLSREPLRSVSAALLAALSGVFVAGESIVGLADAGGPTLLNGILAVLGVCAAVSLMAAAYDFASGSSVLRQRPLVALFVPIWGCLRLVSLFVSYAAVVDRFEDIYHTFTVVMLLLFLFSQTKFLTGVDAERGGKMMFLYGFPAVVAALTDALPNIALLFAGRKTLGTFPTGLFLVNAVLGVYAAVYLAAEGKRRTAVPMVAISPDFTEDGEPDGAEQPLERRGEKGAGKTLHGDPEPQWLDFLQKAYHAEDRFVETEKPVPDLSGRLKS